MEEVEFQAMDIATDLAKVTNGNNVMDSGGSRNTSLEIMNFKDIEIKLQEERKKKKKDIITSPTEGDPVETQSLTGLMPNGPIGRYLLKRKRGLA
ncbi:hypothetical protein Syun_001017 [Stephania yunnanensis]|uniref:Uncharacterized protein n=1 Tax=Stephania yunnanensis TaxID=152371 RepID=A0AAP0Q5V8_9MAGN